MNGDTWDNPIFIALQRDPPVGTGTSAQLHVLKIVMESLGDSAKRFLRVSQSQWTRVDWQTDPVHSTANWWATYYRLMYEALWRSPNNLPGWASVVETTKRARSESNSIVIGMQIGLPLLGPVAAQAAWGRPAKAIVHDANPVVLERLKAILTGDPFIFLGPSAGHQVRAALRQHFDVMANIDTAYEGARTEPLAILGGEINAPLGVCRLAIAADLPIRCMAIILVDGQLVCRITDSFMTDYSERIGAFFSNLISDHPEQWFGWPSLSRQ